MCVCRHSYLQECVAEVGLNEPVIERDVEELVLRSLSETQHLLELREEPVLLLLTSTKTTLLFSENTNIDRGKVST